MHTLYYSVFVFSRLSSTFTVVGTIAQHGDNTILYQCTDRTCSVHIYICMCVTYVYILMQTCGQVQVGGTTSSSASVGGDEGDREGVDQTGGDTPQRGLHEGRPALHERRTGERR